MTGAEGDLILFGTLVLGPGLGLGDLVRYFVGLGHPSVQPAAYSLRSNQFGTSPLPPHQWSNSVTQIQGSLLKTPRWESCTVAFVSFASFVIFHLTANKKLLDTGEVP